MSAPGRDDDRYETIDEGVERELRVLGSRFLARAVHLPDEGAAARRLAAVRKAHHAATHVCWALRLGPSDRPRARFDDDGEPSGTAGRPILRRLEASAVFDALIVVVRYFGGTKLGTGGLARAYGEAARLALESAPRRIVVVETRIEVRCEFADIGTIESVLSRHGADLRAVERSWEPSPRFTLAVARSRAGALATELDEALGGRGRIQIVPTAAGTPPE